MARNGSAKTKRKPIKVKRPGALNAQKKKGESTATTARRLSKSGTPLQRKEANLYLNVFKPANAKRKKKRKSK